MERYWRDKHDLPISIGTPGATSTTMHSMDKSVNSRRPHRRASTESTLRSSGKHFLLLALQMSNVAQQMTSKAGPPEREDSGDVDDDSILNMEVETRMMRIATEMNDVAQQRIPAGDDPILNMEVITVSR